jgi:hypothetical protein
MTRRGVKPFLFSHLDDGVDDMGWGRMAHRGVVTLEPSRVHMPSSQWELVSHRVSQAWRKHHTISFPWSQARARSVHRLDQAQLPVQATNQGMIAFVGPGQA